MRRDERTVLWCAALVIFASGCELPVGTMEIVESDGTVVRLPIARVRVTQETMPEGVPPELAWESPPVAHVEVDLGEQRTFSLDVTLEPSGTWAWSDVCSGRDGRYCDRYPVDVDGDGRVEHLVRRMASGRGELVRAWATFPDDGGGPREVSAAFRFETSDVVRRPSLATWTDAPLP